MDRETPPGVGSQQPEDREEFHGEGARTSFIDVWTHEAMLERLGRLPDKPTIVDVGCSAGYLLGDLRQAFLDASLIGVDLADEGLRKARQNVPDATFLRADVCALPLEEQSADAAVSSNVLEHVADDERALTEMHRILRPRARAVIVVPYGPGMYDYYDRFMGHMRRYAKGELARKARAAGFEVVEDVYLGAPLYPAFWAVKHCNRRRFEHLQGDALKAKVVRDIAGAKDSKLGRLACRVEQRLLARSIRLPFGMRCLTVLVRSY